MARTTIHGVSLPSSLADELRARGLRLTAQRQLVLEAVYRLGHATPDEIVEAVAADGGGGVPVSTVYRALEALQELGLVGHTHVDHRAPSYHLAEHATHLHVVCQECGQISSVDPTLLDAAAERLAADLGFTVDVGHVALSGTCRACAERARTEHP